jgi:hypothetical protein
VVVDGGVVVIAVLDVDWFIEVDLNPVWFSSLL